MFNFKSEPMKNVKLKGKQFRHMHWVYPMAFLCLFSSPSWAAESLVSPSGAEQSKGILVKGTVFDEDKLPIIGANIMVKGTSLGTITDMDGNFNLTVPYEDAVLTVSFIGYTTKDIPLKGQRQLNITLVEDSKTLQEVVVIGYGSQKKTTLTGSVASVNVKELSQSPSANITNALAGRLPGLTVTQFGGGEPGKDVASFAVRGLSSYNSGAQSPIVIVDGVERSLSNLDPNEIETFSILKDASATAMYGSRGANGVILITTKKGAVGKTKVSYNGYYSINSVAAYPDRMNLSEWADFKREAYRTDGQWGGPEDDAKIFGSAYDAVKSNQNVDWVDMLMQTGSQMSHSVNISNGTEKTTFNLAFEYMSEDGLVKMDDMDRYNATLSLSHKLTDNLKLNANVVYTYLDQNIRRDPFNRSIYYAPYGDVYNEDGSINVLPFNDGQTISPIAEEVPGAYKNNRLTSHLVGNVGACLLYTSPSPRD